MITVVTNCPWCKTEITVDKHESVTCPKCESIFHPPEAIWTDELKDKAYKALLFRAENPRPTREKDRVTELHEAALLVILRSVHEDYPDFNISTLTQDKDSGIDFDFEVEGYRVTANLWKGRLYDPRRYDAQLNVHFRNLPIGGLIYLHIKGKTAHEGWKTETGNDKISPWDQMVLDGDVSPQMSAICLAPYQR